MSRKTSQFHWHRLLPWVELFVATIVGLVLYFPLQRKDLADIAWILGLLFTCNGITTTRRLQEEFDTLQKLCEVIDLSQQCDIQEVHRILLLYIAIKEAEFRSLKDEILQRCIAQLSRLAHDKVSEVRGAEYYIWLRDMLRLCAPNERVIAVRILAESPLTVSSAEKGYLNESLQTARRGVKIERIFLSSRAWLQDKRNREVIDQLLEYHKEGVAAYLVWKEELALHDSALMHELGESFVVFNDKVTFIATSIPPNELRGMVTMNIEQRRHCQRLFEQLKLHARRADADLFRTLDEDSTP